MNQCGIIVSQVVRLSPEDNVVAPVPMVSVDKSALIQVIIWCQWRHNERDGVSNHQPHDCLLNRSFRHRSKKTSKLRVTCFCEGNSPVWAVNSPHKGPVAWKMFPFDDVILQEPQHLGYNKLQRKDHQLFPAVQRPYYDPEMLQGTNLSLVL